MPDSPKTVVASKVVDIATILSKVRRDIVYFLPPPKRLIVHAGCRGAEGILGVIQDRLDQFSLFFSHYSVWYVIETMKMYQAFTQVIGYIDFL